MRTLPGVASSEVKPTSTEALPSNQARQDTIGQTDPTVTPDTIEEIAEPQADRDSFLIAQASRDAVREEQERKARMRADIEAHQARRDLIQIDQKRPDLRAAHSRIRAGELRPSDDVAEMHDYNSLLPEGERIDSALLANERFRRVEAQHGPNSIEAMRALADDELVAR